MTDEPKVVEETPPGSDLDSAVRDFFCRIVEREGTITLDMDVERVPGRVRWEPAQTPSGSNEITIWFVPTEQEGENSG